MINFTFYCFCIDFFRKNTIFQKFGAFGAEEFYFYRPKISGLVEFGAHDNGSVLPENISVIFYLCEFHIKNGCFGLF